MVVDDLGKMHSALDNALMRYHRLKLAEVNTIIKDLWAHTYRVRGSAGQPASRVTVRER